MKRSIGELTAGVYPEGGFVKPNGSGLKNSGDCCFYKPGTG
jgi:hypothetical protein